MKCEELIAILNQYVDGELDASICEQLEGHMLDCSPCRVVVDNIRNTIEIYHGAEPVDLPERFRSRLHDAVRECWGRRDEAADDGSAPDEPQPS